MKLLAKFSLIALYALFGLTIYADRISDLGFSPLGGVYLILLALCVVGLISAALVQSHLLRTSYAIAIFSSSTLIISYRSITTEFLTYDTFISLLHSRQFVSDAMLQFGSSVNVAVIMSLALGLAILLPPKRLSADLARATAWTPIVVTSTLAVLFFFRGGDGGKGLASPFVPLAYSTLAVFEAWNGIFGERTEVQIPRAHNDVDFDIILIIDESIAPNYLDINTPRGVRTNLAVTPPDINVFNYGYAAAITHCSFNTNLTIRYGGTRNNYLTTISTMPSIWKYAKNAGMRTVYIDTQRTNNELQNGMSDEEAADIDKFVQFDNVPVVLRDMSAASTIIELTNNKTSEFVMVNKIGAHYPVHDKYPDNFMTYEPALERGRFESISDTGSKVGFSGSPAAWIEYRNSYRNTVQWNVGQFFHELLSKASLENAVIIYTSDHGQNLHENGDHGLDTHCSSDPVIEEGVVPLVVIQGSNMKTLNWISNHKANFNRASHYNIFPTILSLMSFDVAMTESFYGKSLESVTYDPMTFNTLFNARLGKSPTWMQIDPTKVVLPPDCDYDNNPLIAATCSQN